MNNLLKKIIIAILFLIGIILRFYNLNWGSPYYFHPDERQNIVYPIMTSKSLFMLNQQNFDTGTFPLIIIKIIFTFIAHTFHNFLLLDQFSLIILISRIISAVISTEILLLLFYIVKKIFTTTKAYLTLELAIFSVGFIQFSHFGTIELWEALFFLLIFFYTWKIAKYAHKIDSITCGIILGFAIATKILSIILIPGVLISFFLFLYTQRFSENNFSHNLKKTWFAFLFFLFSTVITFSIASPSLITNFHAAYDSIHYESSIALGKIPVFYTQGFTNTTPVIFQFTKVYPFLLNPLITLLFIPSLFSVIIFGIKNRNYAYILLAISFLLLFLTQSFFFVKWTRYMIPTLPFIYIIISVAIDDWLCILKKYLGTTEIFSYFLTTILIVVSFIFTISFFITVYLQDPTPIKANNFAVNNIPKNAKVISEPYDLGIMPFNNHFNNITIFDFYNLENDKKLQTELPILIEDSNYIILPSQRIIKTRIKDPQFFPIGNIFYKNLLSGNLGYKLIYKTPCDIFCQITYLGNPIFSYEETASVFDRPTVFIFKQTKKYNLKYYQTIL